MDPQRIADRYEVVRAIGRGGMGTVWLARDSVLGRNVAVKQIGGLPGEPANETQRAMREARSAAALNHPNAVAVYDVVDHDGRPWLVMEYVEGETLAEVIAREGHLEPRTVADIGSHLASALVRAHERRIVHRDIKPGNVLIDRSGRPKISDFGIARGHGDDALTQTGFVTGTPGYLSPELARGEDPDNASDVWALGATLYAAVEGRPPYAPRSNPIALLQAIATQPPEPMEHAGPLSGAIAAMMDADPARRWDMATAARELGRVASGEATLAMPATGAAAGAAATEVFPTLGEPTRAMPAPAPAGAAAAGAAAYETREPAPVGPPTPPEDEPRRSRRWIPLLLVALLLLGLGGAYLASQTGNNPGTTTPPQSTSSRPTTAKTSAKPAPTTTQAPTTSQAPTTTQAPSTTTTQGGQLSDQQLSRFIRSYFKDVTRDRDTTWQQLTPRMQQAAGGRDGYEGFWQSIEEVKVDNLQSDAAAGTVTATLTYKRKDGDTTEQHKLTVVEQGDSFLIDTDQRIG